MASFKDREHIRQLSVIGYVVMLALILPLTIFLAQKEQEVRTRASSNFNATAGRPFADDSAWNQAIGSNVEIDPGSAAMVAKLATGKQGAGLYDFGTPIFFADSSTPKYQINCTEDWGTCGLEGQQVPIPDAAQPAPGSDGQMVVIDLAANKSYEFWVYQKDKANTAWGAVLPLNGTGSGTAANSAVGAGVSRLAGVIRTYEIEQGVIDHALVFSTKYCLGPTNSTNFRFPATKTDGKYSGEGAIPEGARVQLDPTINVDSIAGISKGEKAVAKALQKYGAYVIDCGGAEMAFSFENPIGKTDPYPAAGFTGDYFEMDKIPWDKLRVLKAWNSSTGGPINPGLTGTANPTFGVIAPCPSCSSPTMTLNPSGVVPVFPSGSVEPSGVINNPSPCDATNTSVATNKKSKHNGHSGSLSGFMETLLRFFLELLNLLLRLLGGGQIPFPNPNPGPDPVPVPCMPEPSVVPSQPMTPSIAVPSTVLPSTALPSVLPSQAAPNPSTGVINGTVLWRGDPDSGRNQWSKEHVVNPSRITVETIGGRKAWKMQLNDGDRFSGERAEFGQDNDTSRDFNNGDEVWLGHSFYMPSDFPTNVNWTVLTQWKDQDPDGGSPSWGTYVQNDKIEIDGQLANKIFSTPATKNVWHNLVWHMKLSDTNNGLVEIYYSTGANIPRKVASKTQKTYRPPSTKMVPRMGYYRDPNISTNNAIYHANWTVGTSFDAVNPAR